MSNVSEFAHNLIKMMDFEDYRVEINEEQRQGMVFIHSHETIVKENLPQFVESINHLVQLVAKKSNIAPMTFDVNNYRKEREKLIVELARAAARKVLATKGEVSLPAMNSYERRIVHLELSSHPEVSTESLGVGRERYVVVKPIA